MLLPIGEHRPFVNRARTGICSRIDITVHARLTSVLAVRAQMVPLARGVDIAVAIGGSSRFAAFIVMHGHYLPTRARTGINYPSTTEPELRRERWQERPQRPPIRAERERHRHHHRR